MQFKEVVARIFNVHPFGDKSRESLAGPSEKKRSGLPEAAAAQRAAMITPAFGRLLKEYFQPSGGRWSPFFDTKTSNPGWLVRHELDHSAIRVALGDWSHYSGENAVGGTIEGVTSGTSGFSTLDLLDSPDLNTRATILETTEVAPFVAELEAIFIDQIEMVTRQLSALLHNQETTGWSGIAEVVKQSLNNDKFDVRLARPFLHLISVQNPARAAQPDIIEYIVLGAALRKVRQQLLREGATENDNAAGKRVMILSSIFERYGWKKSWSGWLVPADDQHRSTNTDSLFSTWLEHLNRRTEADAVRLMMAVIAFTKDLGGENFFPGLLHMLWAAEQSASGVDVEINWHETVMQGGKAPRHTNFVYPIVLSRGHHIESWLDPDEHNWKTKLVISLPEVTAQQWEVLFGQPWMTQQIRDELYAITEGAFNHSFLMASIFSTLDPTIQGKEGWTQVPVAVLKEWLRTHILQIHPSFSYANQPSNFDKLLQELLFLADQSDESGRFDKTWIDQVFPESIYSDAGQRFATIASLLSAVGRIVVLDESDVTRGIQQQNFAGKFDPICFRLMRLLINKGFVFSKSPYLERRITLETSGKCGFCNAGMSRKDQVCSHCGAPAGQAFDERTEASTAFTQTYTPSSAQRS